MKKPVRKKSKKTRSSNAASESVTIWRIKFLIAIALDIVDFTAGRLFGIGIVSNFVLTIAGVGLFGWRGLIHLWEFIDPTHQIDGFVPTLSLIALANHPDRPPKKATRSRRR
ncbi:MAG: hypothetical protein ACWA5T_03330 [Parvularcula sp.]